MANIKHRGGPKPHEGSPIVQIVVVALLMAVGIGCAFKYFDSWRDSSSSLYVSTSSQ